MVEIYRFIRANNYRTRMILQVHDSLLQMVADEEAEELLPYLRWLQTERDLFSNSDSGCSKCDLPGVRNKI